jgi:Family of unknown function (DUF6152)
MISNTNRTGTFGRIAACLVGLSMGLFAASAFAHHSFTAEYDPTKPVKLHGKVTEMKWSNPHGWIYVDVVGTDGKVVNWALETGGANGLYRRGWRKEDLPAGTEVTFEGWQARNGKPTANISTITFKDGRRLFAGTSNNAAPQQ